MMQLKCIMSHLIAKISVRGGKGLRTKDDILKILDLLEEHIADDFEAQDLDFKEWCRCQVTFYNFRSIIFYT